MSTLQERIERKLQDGIRPVHLAVVNESGMHNVPAGSETHFRVLVVSPGFAGSPRLARHRTVHSLLADELAGGVHALAIDAWTPEEWQRQGSPSVSPACRGGDGGQRAHGSG
jgi:BolA family transcriptional regulator, general stress-responsive regulator